MKRTAFLVVPFLAICAALSTLRAADDGGAAPVTKATDPGAGKGLGGVNPQDLKKLQDAKRALRDKAAGAAKANPGAKAAAAKAKRPRTRPAKDAAKADDDEADAKDKVETGTLRWEEQDDDFVRDALAERSRHLWQKSTLNLS